MLGNCFHPVFGRIFSFINARAQSPTDIKTIFISLFIAVFLGLDTCHFFCKSNDAAYFEELYRSLNHHVKGQEIAARIMATVLATNKHNPTHSRKPAPLILSFHGPSGTGRVLMAKTVARKWQDQVWGDSVGAQTGITMITYQGYTSNSYEKIIRKAVQRSLVINRRSIFIIESAENAPPDLFHKDHLEESFPSHVEQVIFLLVSEIGAEAIHELAEAQIKLGESRETIPTNHLTLDILTDAVGTGWYSLLRNDATLVPFLPLERNHVQHCVRIAITASEEGKNKTSFETEQIVQIAMSETKFSPPDSKLFARNGCGDVTPASVKYWIKRAMDPD